MSMTTLAEIKAEAIRVLLAASDTDVQPDEHDWVARLSGIGTVFWTPRKLVESGFVFFFAVLFLGNLNLRGAVIDQHAVLVRPAHTLPIHTARL
jgi:hypothetical protein